MNIFLFTNIAKLKKKIGKDEDDEIPKKEKEIDIKKRKVEESINTSLTKLNILDIATPGSEKPMTAGFMTSRNHRGMIMSSEGPLRGKNFTSCYRSNGSFT